MGRRSSSSSSSSSLRHLRSRLSFPSPDDAKSVFICGPVLCRFRAGEGRGVSGTFQSAAELHPLPSCPVSQTKRLLRPLPACLLRHLCRLRALHCGRLRTCFAFSPLSFLHTFCSLQESFRFPPPPFKKNIFWRWHFTVHYTSIMLRSGLGGGIRSRPTSPRSIHAFVCLFV